MKISKYSSRFSVQSQEQQDLMDASMRSRGLDVPIDIWKNPDSGDMEIINGRHRYFSAIRCNVEPVYKTFEGSEAEVRAYTISTYATTRTPTATQKACSAVGFLKDSQEVETVSSGTQEDQGRTVLPSILPGLTQSEAAEHPPEPVSLDDTQDNPEATKEYTDEPKSFKELHRETTRVVGKSQYSEDEDIGVYDNAVEKAMSLLEKAIRVGKPICGSDDFNRFDAMLGSNRESYIQYLRDLKTTKASKDAKGSNKSSNKARRDAKRHPPVIDSNGKVALGFNVGGKRNVIFVLPANIDEVKGKVLLKYPSATFEEAA